MNHEIKRLLKRERFDYFLIWGHGMPHKEKILNMIRSKSNIEILRIMYHRPKNISSLVKAVYSYDYAPFHHLKAKTEYLLNTEAEVMFVFLRNEDVKEVSLGTGEFQHIECDRIKAIKEDIRNRFNPRRNGERTEDHVVHASDNESQVHNILKYLGFDEGIGLFRDTPNSLLSLPYYLPKFDRFTVRCVNASRLYCTILKGSRKRFRKETVRIEQTPHFACLKGDTDGYERYLSKFLGGPLTRDYSVERFMALANRFRYLEPPDDTSYILVEEPEPDQYLVWDGIHRASILRFNGVERFPVAVIE